MASLSKSRLVLVGLLVAAFWLNPEVASADSQDRSWPIDGHLTRKFERPENQWGPGHRGIDLSEGSASEVKAAADGVVSWVGNINNVPMISVQHEQGLRTTYQPVAAAVQQGERVTAGETIGTLQLGHGDGQALHFGLLRDQTYLDPLNWLMTGKVPLPRVRLLDSLTKLSQPLDRGATGRLRLTSAKKWPVTGPITSPFGWRINPLSGSSELHDGTDIGVPCGTPVISPWAGSVTAVGNDRWRGNYLELRHLGLPSGSRYLHLSLAGVQVGQTIQPGQVIGLSGTTGNSTGCHLHFSVLINHDLVNPANLIQA